jgi:hypothetical protein
MWSKLFGKARHADHGVKWAEPVGGVERAAIYQICYSPETRAAVDPDFLPLDNSANRRPDWREYHPIRSFLQNAPLDENRYYGFLSTKFRLKTGLSGARVHDFIERQAGIDVVLFSPYIDLQALFVNSFVQGDYFHPGLLSVAEGVFGHMGYDQDLQVLVTDHRRSVFSNYFVAKPPFWRAWLEATEELYRLAEQSGPLRKLLTTPARYSDGERAEFKVFLLERVVDLLLATHPWTSTPFPDSKLSDLPVFPENVELVQEANSLKAAFRDSGNPAHMDRYVALLAEHSIPPEYQELLAIWRRRQGGDA